MARKNVLLYQLLKAQSLSTSFTSPVTSIRYGDNVSYQINITTTDSTGSFVVEASDDYSVTADNVIVNPGNWVTLTLSGSPTVAATNDIIGISMTQLPYLAIRLRYVSSTPGTGVCDAFITSKEIGG